MNPEIFSKENSLSVAPLKSLRITLLLPPCFLGQCSHHLSASVKLLLIYCAISSHQRRGECAETIEHVVSLADLQAPDRDKELKLNCKDYDVS